MKYTQITKVPGKPETSREITEAKLIRLMSQIMINRQSGEDNEWRCIYTPDYLKIVRYELIRRHKDRGEIVTYFIPNGEIEEKEAQA